VAPSLLAAAALLIAAPLPAAAHPLGDSSVNAYDRVEVAGDGIHVRYVLDVSERIALEEQRFADTNDDGTVDSPEATVYLDAQWLQYLQPKLVLVVAGQALRLTRDAQELSFPAGQGGLPLLRAVYDLTAPLPAVAPGGVLDGSLAETTFDNLPGWHEIVVRQGAGAALLESSVPAEDLTNELRTYPADRLGNPLNVRFASFRFSVAAGASPSIPGGSPGPSASPGASASLPPSPLPSPVASASASPAGASPAPGTGGGHGTDPLVALVDGDLSGVAILGAILVALGLGALHAVSPGHGKTLIAAYVMGTRAHVAQGAWLGLTVAATHTAGVFLLGVATYLATEWIIPDRIVSWLSVATGLLILGLGAILVWRAWATRRVISGHEHGAHGGHEHGHDQGAQGGHEHGRDQRAADGHEHPHAGHAHLALPTLRHRDVAALGIVGGLVPSGSALLLLLSSIALGQVALGVVLIVAFGAGMAIVLAGISMGVVLLRRSSFERRGRWRDPRLARLASAVPVVSGLVVIAFGLVVTVQALASLR
jgi:ABC-type nickel/cobalt efflux system permease component RcnA